MGVFHRATVTPTKAELIANWAPTQPWGPSTDAALDVVGSSRFDDPENRVGIESHLVVAEGRLLHVPLTYRDEPVGGAEDALITEMQHSELGTRWVYDGRWHIAPTTVRIQGGGWTQGRVPVDGFERVAHDTSAVVFHNDRFELTFLRQPVVGPRPAIGLTATWEGQADPVVLAEVKER